MMRESICKARRGYRIRRPAMGGGETESGESGDECLLGAYPNPYSYSNFA